MTDLYATSKEVVDRFHAALATAGFTPQHIERIADDPQLATEWLEFLAGQGPFPGYVEPEMQVERNMHRWLADHPEWEVKLSDVPSIAYPAPDGAGWVLNLNLPDADNVVRGVQRTFDAAWDLVSAPSGLTKFRHPEVRSDPDHLRLTPGKVNEPGFSWVLAEPFAHWDRQNGVRPDRFWTNDFKPVNLAGPEGLWFLAHFPDYCAVMGTNKAPHMDLPGYQMRFGDVTDDTAWARCPYVDRWGDESRFGLSASLADFANPGWAALGLRDLEEAA